MGKGPTVHLAVYEALPGAKKPTRSVLCGVSLSYEEANGRGDDVVTRQLTEEPSAVTCGKCRRKLPREELRVD